LPEVSVVLKRVTQQPLVQVLPAQHGPAVEAVVPGVPHTVQRELLQMVFASLHVLPAQQGPPAAPHTWQMLVALSQAAVASLHPVGFAVVVVQQGSPRAPQVLQVERPVELLYRHCWAGSLHAVVPVAVDTVQQGWPAPPHGLHAYTPVELSGRHCVPASVQVLPEQQGPPVLPQAAHTEVVAPTEPEQFRS
jgi:hypothetical protein